MWVGHGSISAEVCFVIVTLIGRCCISVETVSPSDCDDAESKCTTVTLPPNNKFTCEEFCRKRNDDGGFPIDSNTCLCVKKPKATHPPPPPSPLPPLQTPEALSYSDCQDQRYRCIQVDLQQNPTLNCNRFCKSLGFLVGIEVVVPGEFPFIPPKIICVCIKRIIIVTGTIETTSDLHDNSATSGDKINSTENNEPLSSTVMTTPVNQFIMICNGTFLSLRFYITWSCETLCGRWLFPGGHLYNSTHCCCYESIIVTRPNPTYTQNDDTASSAVTTTLPQTTTAACPGAFHTPTIYNPRRCIIVCNVWKYSDGYKANSTHCCCYNATSTTAVTTDSPSSQLQNNDVTTDKTTQNTIYPNCQEQGSIPVDNPVYYPCNKYCWFNPVYVDGYRLNSTHCCCILRPTSSDVAATTSPKPNSSLQESHVTTLADTTTKYTSSSIACNGTLELMLRQSFLSCNQYCRFGGYYVGANQSIIYCCCMSQVTETSPPSASSSEYDRMTSNTNGP